MAVSSPERPTLQDVMVPPPSPIPPWTKVLWYVFNVLATGSAWLKYEFGDPIYPTPLVEADPAATHWRHFDMEFTNVASGDTADTQVVGFDILNITNGKPDSSWTMADHDYCAAALHNTWEAIKAHYPTWVNLHEIRAYDRMFNPITLEKPFPDSGSPVYLKPYASPGTQPAGLPPQACTTVTEMTADRRHWGRFYMPTLAVQALDTTGRLSVAAMTDIGTQFSATYGGLYAADYIPVVVNLRRNEDKHHPIPEEQTRLRALSSVIRLEVDDVPDVIRRRRYATVVNRYTTP